MLIGATSAPVFPSRIGAAQRIGEPPGHALVPLVVV
jgi:hypothetical protein